VWKRKRGGSWQKKEDRGRAVTLLVNHIGSHKFRKKKEKGESPASKKWANLRTSGGKARSGFEKRGQYDLQKLQGGAVTIRKKERGRHGEEKKNGVKSPTEMVYEKGRSGEKIGTQDRRLRTLT